MTFHYIQFCSPNLWSLLLTPSPSVKPSVSLLDGTCEFGWNISSVSDRGWIFFFLIFFSFLGLLCVGFPFHGMLILWPSVRRSHPSRAFTCLHWTVLLVKRLQIFNIFNFGKIRNLIPGRPNENLIRLDQHPVRYQINSSVWSISGVDAFKYSHYWLPFNASFNLSPVKKKIKNQKRSNS